MNARSKTLAVALSASIAVGCTQTQWIGAGSGLATGALAGGLIGGDWKGALIGAASGAALGWGAAKLIEYNSTQVRTPKNDQQIYGVAERVDSPIVKVRKGSSTPAQVRPGDQVNVMTDYSLLLPPGATEADVQESWALKKDGNLLTQIPPQNTHRTAGGWEATASIAVPKQAPAGTYVVEHKVQTGSSYDTDDSVFVVSAK